MIGLARLDSAEYVGEGRKGPIQSLLGAQGNVDKTCGATPGRQNIPRSQNRRIQKNPYECRESGKHIAPRTKIPSNARKKCRAYCPTVIAYRSGIALLCKKLLYYAWRYLKDDWVIKNCAHRCGWKWGPLALEFLRSGYRKYLRVVALSLRSRRALFHRTHWAHFIYHGNLCDFIDIGRLSS